MKELKTKLTRYLSAILMVAMVITGTPQAAMAAVEADSLADPNIESVDGGTETGSEEVSQAELAQEEVENVGEEEPVEVEPANVEPMGANEDTINFTNDIKAKVTIKGPSGNTSFIGGSSSPIISDNIVFVLGLGQIESMEHYVFKVTCNIPGKLSYNNVTKEYTYKDESGVANSVTITINREQYEWPVTFAEDYYSVQYEDENNAGAYIDYSAPVYVSDGNLKFTVSANSGYDVISVSCGQTPIEPDEDGLYSLDTNNEAKTVTVNTAIQPKVTFSTTTAAVSYSTTGAEGEFAAYNDEFQVPRGTEVFFKATPVQYYKTPITVSSNHGSFDEADGIYSKVISADTTFTVAATPIEHTVSFNMTGVNVEYNTVSDGDVYIPYNGTPIIIPQNGKLYYKLTATERYEGPFTTDKSSYNSTSESYTVTADLTSPGRTTTITVSAKLMKTVSFHTTGASVAYSTVSDGTYTTFSNTAIPVKKGEKFWFKVAPVANYTTPITVKDKASGENITTSENGAYFVTVNESDRTIEVEATEIRHKVSFDCVSGNFGTEGIQYTLGEGNPDTKYTYNTALDVHQGKTVKFSLDLKNAYVDPVVKVGSKELKAIADVYSYTITEDTTISITATKKPTVSFNIVGENPFDSIFYGFAPKSLPFVYSETEIPITSGGTFYYAFDMKSKYDEFSLSVKINGKEQTPNEDGIYQKSGITDDVIITATAKAEILDVTFENPTEAVVTISEASMPKVDLKDKVFKDKAKKFTVEKNDAIKFKVSTSGNYVGRTVTVKTVTVKEGLNYNKTISPDEQGVYSIEAVDNITIEVLPNVNYTFTNSGNAITFNNAVSGTFTDPQNGLPNATTISQLNIPSGKNYFFRVTPDSDKAIDYVRIDGKDVAAVAQDTTSSTYKVNAKVDTLIEVKSDTKYQVKFEAENGDVAKVCKDGSDKDYSETLGNDDIKVIAGAKEFKFKVQAADSYKITSVSVNDTATALKADKDEVYTISANGVAAKPIVTVTIKSEKQSHKVTFVNNQKATIKYKVDGTVSEGNAKIINTVNGVVDNVVKGSTFMVEAPDKYQVMQVARGKDKDVTEIAPNEFGIYTIDSLNADETITITCRKSATGIKYNKSTLSENEIDQIANTVATYKMDITGVDKKFEPTKDLLLSVTTGDHDSVSMSKVDYNTIHVKVTTPYEYSDDTTSDVVFAIKEGNKVLKTIKVTATKPVLKAPSVAVSDIRDDSAVLTLKDNSKQVINEGKVYYHISATKQVSDSQVPIDLAALNNTLLADTDAFSVGTGKDIYVPADATSKAFTTKVEVNFRELNEFTGDLDVSKGYNVSVNACISKDGGAHIDLDDSASTVLKKDFNLNASKYETNLKLSKAAPQYVTGQLGVPIAKVTWSKGTTYRGFKQLYLNTADGKTFSGDDLVVKDDIIYLNDTVKLNATGTYTVVAQPESKAYDTKLTTLKFKVAKGIEKLGPKDKEVEILRAKGKKVIYQLPTLIYNEGDPVDKPASKKVTYTLSRVDEASLTDNDKLIKVAKGKVTIDKKYVFDAAKPVQYKVTVKANDYKENSESITCKFTIKETGATSLKYLYICELVDNQYVPVDTSVALGGDQYYIIATKDKVTDEIAYNSDNIIKTNEYSLKSSNLKVKIDSESYAYEIEPTAYAKNVTFTATATDGSKAKISLKNVTFEDYLEDLWFDVFTTTSGDGKKIDEPLTISTLNNEVITIREYAKYAGVDAVDALFSDKMSANINANINAIDYKVTADKGLKIVESEKGMRTVLFTGKKLTKDEMATGTLTYTYYKLVKGERVKTTKKLTIVNDKKWVNKAAPAARQLNTLYAVKTSPQSISFSVAKRLPDTANMVRITQVAGNKNSSYKYLYENSNLSKEISITNRTFIIPLLTYDIAGNAVEAGTYKYIITYGHKVGGKFVEDTGATTLKIKVTNEKAKVTKSYTMSEVMPSTAITGKFSTGTTVTGTDLWNANIRGTINRFKDYFELSADGKRIELKAAKGIADKGNAGIDTEEEAKALQDTIEYLTQKANKNDLVGYLSYDVDGSNVTETIQVTMKINTNAASAKAFKTSKKAVAVSGSDIELKHNKKDTKYAYAYTDANSDSVSLNATVKNGDVIISGQEAEETGSVKNAYVYVLKTDSPYVPYINTLATPADKNAAIEKYGVKVNLGKITVK